MASGTSHSDPRACSRAAGRVGVAEVVSAVQVDRIQQGITGDRQRRPPAGQPVLVVVVDRSQAAACSSPRAAATVAGRNGRRPAAVSRDGDQILGRSCTAAARSATSGPTPSGSGCGSWRPATARASGSTTTGGHQLALVNQYRARRRVVAPPVCAWSTATPAPPADRVLLRRAGRADGRGHV
jgi:hypothetical protein